MSRVRLTVVTALAGIAALTACSSSSDGPNSDSSKGDGDKPVSTPAAKPITKALAQADITQALLGDGETLPGWTLHGDKDVTDGEYCNSSDNDFTPAGWVRGGDSSYEYNGSTINMAFVHICLFDSVKSATKAYTTWKGTETSKQQAPKPPVGSESTLVINPGASEDTVYGFTRSGRANIRVKIEGGTGDDPSGAQAMLSATLKRLQQLQDGKSATVTAPDELAAAKP
ncbi:hypothetical protein [Streptomyces cavernicola]|uniref:DUF3558 domain-containing protein n=1 Tax=Streptomyces cavernicola TaxID=3043613 RepID=A0ABT6SM58_9ACTN|nr:hypothetical protein [Streptomyces sp. B-S-A6]MDI3409277.1 hypothetical protein [Streptomyces sp. B-S-A6]